MLDARPIFAAPRTADQSGWRRATSRATSEGPPLWRPPLHASHRGRRRSHGRPSERGDTWALAREPRADQPTRRRADNAALVLEHDEGETLSCARRSKRRSHRPRPPPQPGLGRILMRVGGTRRVRRRRAPLRRARPVVGPSRVRRRARQITEVAIPSARARPATPGVGVREAERRRDGDPKRAGSRAAGGRTAVRPREPSFQDARHRAGVDVRSTRRCAELSTAPSSRARKRLHRGAVRANAFRAPASTYCSVKLLAPTGSAAHRWPALGGMRAAG